MENFIVISIILLLISVLGFKIHKIEKRVNYYLNKNRGLKKLDYFLSGRPNGAVYEVRIENTTNEKKTAILFGYNKFYRAENFGSDSGIKITNRTGSNYESLIAETIQGNGIDCSFIRVIQTSNAGESEEYNQLNQILTHVESHADGATYQAPVIRDKANDSLRQQLCMVDIAVELNFNAKKHLEIPILPNTVVHYIFFEKAKR